MQEIHTTYVGTYCGLPDYYAHFDISLVRVPYTCPDPIAELSMAADKLVELGAPEAARVLMLWLSMSDRDRERLNKYQSGDSVSIFRTVLDELTGRRSWRSAESLTNPEPQP